LDILSDGNEVLVVVVLFYDGVSINRESPSIYRHQENIFKYKWEEEIR
jgi:hypothetical protein